VVFEPGRAGSRALGLNPMATDRIDLVLQAGVFEAGAALRRPELRGLLEPLVA